MGCWRWFNKVLKDAGVEVTDKNEEKVEELIHKYIGEKASYGQCSSDWRKAQKQIQDNLQMRQELLEKLKPLA